MESLVSVKNISKKFGRFTAVSGVSFAVERGEVLGFLGPNGAGKTTTMRIITGYYSPTSGEAQIHGCNVGEDPISAQKYIGYLPEGGPLYNDMTVLSFLQFIGKIRGLESKLLDKRIDYVIEKLNLAYVTHKNIDTLSKGFKRRVALGQAILHDPEVLILDEPTDGLDPNQKHEVHQLIASIAKEKAIILSTHILEEVEAICSKIIIISEGKIVTSGTPDKIAKESPNYNSVIVKIKKQNSEILKKEFLKLTKISDVQIKDNGRIVIFPKGKKPIMEEINKLIVKNKWDVEEISPYYEQGYLNEAFRLITNTDSKK